MKKRIMSLILGVALALSLTVPALAVTYSDLTNHWAKTYLEAMADSGYMNGYTDGTMKPDKSITYSETLTILSRLYTLTDLQLATIRADYENTVKSSVPSSLQWAYSNIEICMAAGIITESELKSADLTANIQKEQLALFLVRAMQLTNSADALSGTKPDFNDADSISTNCIGSVAELKLINIVNGDESNNFLPKSTVTRAVVATMLSRSLDYLETNGKTLVISAYDNLLQSDGVIISVSGNDVMVRGFDGRTRLYTISVVTDVTVGGTASTLTDSYVGCYVLATTRDKTLMSLAVTNSTSVKWEQGILNSVSENSAANFIYVTNLETGSAYQHTVAKTAAVTQEGVTIPISSLKTSYFVSLKYENSVVTEIRAVSGDYSVTGTVSEITIGTTVTLKLTDSKNTEYNYKFNISNLPVIKRGDTIISIDRVRAGSSITLLMDDCAVSSITIQGAETTVTGELTAINTTSSGTVWTINSSTGGTATYTLDPAAAFYSGTKEVSSSDINVGDTVTLSIFDNEIIEVSVQYVTSSSTKVSGTVLNVDSANRQITILTSSGKMVYISTTYLGIVLNASTGSTTYYSAIPANSNIVAYGSYSDTRNFSAKSIVIE